MSVQRTRESELHRAAEAVEMGLLVYFALRFLIDGEKQLGAAPPAA